MSALVGDVWDVVVLVAGADPPKIEIAIVQPGGAVHKTLLSIANAERLEALLGVATRQALRRGES